MHAVPSALCGLALALASYARAGNPAHSPSAADLALALRRIAPDPARTYRVRELALTRGDIKLYLNEGVLSFLTPVDGRTVAALFTIEGAEAGDAELILMPPQRSERASLASFAKSPNLDEHFGSALFFFTDNTAQELTDAINAAPLREAPDVAAAVSERIAPVARTIAGEIEVQLIEALLDHHAPADGLFYAVIGGRTLGAFDVTYDPTDEEPVTVGRVSSGPGKNFQIWTNFRPRNAGPFTPPEPRIRDYRLNATVENDLTLAVEAQFGIRTEASDGRVLPLSLSPRLQVSAASVDGVPVEVFQRPPRRLEEFGSADTLLLVSDAPLAPGGTHQVSLHYAGSVIRQTASGEYFVDDRNTWYPVDGPVAANFDLTFHCPERLRLIATGEPVSETVDNGIRTVHRRTMAPAALAGFNLGNYSIHHEEAKPYSIEIDSPIGAEAAFAEDPTLASQTANILEFYTNLWTPLPIHSLAISPIAGYFGQGFPGLIYLSSVAYVKKDQRANSLRSSRMDAFFSQILLPHEIAHQWWGNIVRHSDYRSSWITEAMANLSALEYVDHALGADARNDLLESYRRDLLQDKSGEIVESAGPVDFGERLIDTAGMSVWHVILYEKGSWILHMLRRRLGEDNFRQMQLRLLTKYGQRPLSNEEFRRTAAEFVPVGQPDRTLENFFSTWVYGTGIPALALHNSTGSVSLTVSGVADDFLVEVPLHCREKGTFWVRAGAGDNTFTLPRGASSCELPSPRDFLYKASR